MPAPIVFLDTETTGLGPDDEPWEIAAIRRDPDGTETELEMFVEHDTSRIPNLPQRFRIDWATRYDPEDAVSRDDAGSKLGGLLDRPGGFERCVIVASNPAFDLRMIEPLIRMNGFELDDLTHYRPVDVGALAFGHLAARAAAGAPVPESVRHPRRGMPWSSDDLSRALGIDPDDFDRHTAMGDVRWVKAIYDIVTGPSA